MSRHLDLDLDHLRTLIVRMGSLVEDQVEYAVKAVIDGDLSLARFVIERDAKVDEFDNEID
jgi:phosphate transport system protein